MKIGEYLEQVRAQYQSGHATEHSYRPALHALFESIDPALTVINEPKKSEAGMPDFLFQRGDIPLGWAEAKDIDKDVIKLRGYSIEQHRRYEKAYPNLIYTNGVDFEFIREGEGVHFVSIASFLGQLGVLHSPAYRAAFAEFLKIAFPRIPYPPSPEVFRHVSEKGEQLRRLHLMEPAAIGETPYPYHGEGDDVVASGFPKWEKSSPERGGGPAQPVEGPERLDPSVSLREPPPRSGEDLARVHINKDQYFADVPRVAWDFYIGGYQPAQKWLKDRRGRSLSFEDIKHYQAIVKILVETDRIMKEIELPIAQ